MQYKSIFLEICGNILHWFAPPISQQILCGPPNEITLNKCPCLYFIPLSYLRHHTILSIHTAQEKFIFPLIYKGLLSRAKECSVDKRLWLYHQHYKCSCLHVNLRCDKKTDIIFGTSIKGKITWKCGKQGIKFNDQWYEQDPMSKRNSKDRQIEQVYNWLYIRPPQLWYPQNLNPKISDSVVGCS